MQKAISIDQNRPIARILSVADISAVETSPNSLTYIAVEWIDAPSIDNVKEVAYPMYNTQTKEMFWQVVEYQNTINLVMIDNMNMKVQINELNSELERTTHELATTQDELITTQDELITTQAELISTQAELATTQEALDFILMGGAE